MAGNNLSDSTTRDAIADHLAAVTAQLPGPPSARVAVTGRLGRWLGRIAHRATLPPTAAAVAGLAAVVADLTQLDIITGQAPTGPGSHVWAPVVVAASASLTRVTLAGRAARRCLATRAALT